MTLNAIVFMAISITAAVLVVRERIRTDRECWLEATVVKCRWRSDGEAVQAGENRPRGRVLVPSGGGGRDATSAEAGRAH